MKKLPFVIFSLVIHFSINATERPNILFILLDDLGWKDTSYMGSDFYETPNLDKLAQEGMIFTNAYSAAANCAPARASLLSGQYTPRHQVFNVGTKPRGESQFRRLIHIPGVSNFDSEIITWADCLQKSNYKTATIGKWHLSNDPTQYGFHENIGGTNSGSPPKGYYPPHPNAPGLNDVPKNEFLTDTLTRKACHFIRDNKDLNWALYLTLFAVHTPIQAKKNLVSKYTNKTSGAQHSNIPMATMIQAVDDGVGKIVAELKTQGIRENTVILFTSDNGGYGPATDMTPLKGYKGTYYEGGIRVPFFVNWPGQVNPNQQSNIPIIGVDLYPTICSIAGAEMPTDQPYDGKDLVPIFKQHKPNKQEWTSRPLYWHFPAYLQNYQRTDSQRDPLFRTRPCSIIRLGDWKLHEYHEKNAFELYNLKEDIAETNNLFNQHPEKALQLKTMLKDWQKQINAPIPSVKNPNFNPAKEARAIKKALQPKR